MKSSWFIIRLLILVLIVSVVPLQGNSQAQEEQPSGPIYIVQEGDTLWDIAGTFYRDPFQWYRIYRYSRNNIKDPDLIFAGQRIYIPEK